MFMGQQWTQNRINSLMKSDMLQPFIDGPWNVAGDFNKVRSGEDRSRVAFSETLIMQLETCRFKISLGPIFTILPYRSLSFEN
jgi:hypothetical protein